MAIFISLFCVRLYAASTLYNPSDFLIARTLTSTPILDDLRYLSDTIGGRPTGSLAMNNAMQWGLQRFKAAGFKDAFLQEYTAPRNWLANIEKGEVIVSAANQAVQKNSLRVAAMPFSASTPTAGLEAPLYAIDLTEVKNIKAHANQIKGHWLLVSTVPMHTIDDLFSEYLETPPIFSAAKEVGATGVLWISNRSGKLLYRHNVSLDGNLVSLPAAVIEREGGERIIRLLKSGKSVTVKITLQDIVQEKPHNDNVVAEIRGYEKPDEVIILGAHLDSWDLGQGALDNGCNVAMVIDAARQMMVLAQQGVLPRRTVRFMLYSGEELGMYGSRFDVRNNSIKLDNIKAVIIYDIGTGRTTGFSLGGRSDMIDLVARALRPINNLGPFTLTTDAFIGTDNFDYLLKGIPTLVANQDASPYLPSYHAESDTFDKIDSRELKLNAAIVSVLTWNLANARESIPPRQNADQINQLVQSTGLKKQMEIYNIWNSFIKKQR